MRYRVFLPVVLCGILLTGCSSSSAENDSSSAQVAPSIIKEKLLNHARVLSSDEYQGRQTGTAGGQMAAGYVRDQMLEIGLAPACGENLIQEFTFESGRTSEPVAAQNLIGVVRGTDAQSNVTMNLPSGVKSGAIIITAHFDHLGTRGMEIFNGADDNASGTSLMLEMARYFNENTPKHTILFAGLDAEEMGLRGASAFVESSCFSRFDIRLNVNLDMISRSEEFQLWASGTFHHPFLRPILDRVEKPDGFLLSYGHDESEMGSDDWTFASDHGPFHKIGIPFVYFGVEDHAGYHTPTDVFEAITPIFFHQAGEVILKSILGFDQQLDEFPERDD